MKVVILVVDDEDMVRTMTRRVLERAGYAVIEACGGEEAIARYRPGLVNLVVTDCHMPGLSGPALVEHLLGLDAQARFLVHSGNPPRLPVNWPVIAKPCSSSELLAVVARVLAADPPGSRG